MPSSSTFHLSKSNFVSVNNGARPPASQAGCSGTWPPTSQTGRPSQTSQTSNPAIQHMKISNLAIHSSCSRCLSLDHQRSSSKRPIKCHACLSWGHIASSCPMPDTLVSRHDQDRIKGKAAMELNANLG